MKIPQPPLFPRFKFHPPFFWPSFDKLLQSLSIFQRLLKWRIQWCGSDGRNYFFTDTVNMNSQICKQSYWKYEKVNMSGKNSFAKFQILQAPLKKFTPLFLPKQPLLFEIFTFTFCPLLLISVKFSTPPLLFLRGVPTM